MKLFFYAIVLLSSVSVHAATLLLESFDDMNPGSIDTQNGWVLEQGIGTVQSNVVHSGTQALEIQEARVSHALPAADSAVWLSLNAYVSSAPQSNHPLDELGNGLAFFVNTNLNLVVTSNAVPVEAAVDVPINSWIRFDVYCDFEESFWNLSMNGTNVVSGLPLPAAFTQAVSFVVGNEDSESGYIDQIEVSDHEQVPESGAQDADGDGIADWWEQKYFGGITAVTDPDAMAENGVHTLLETYIAGLSPSERFEISSMDSSSLQWSGQPGRRYAVHSTTNLISGFTLLEENIPWDQTQYIYNTEAAADFFKILVELDH